MASAGEIAVVMGVSGSGKTTLARLLAERLGWDLADADDMHPPANIAKMSAGEPLTDADRQPWLARVAAWIDAQIAGGRGGVIACSALRRSYRDRLRRPQVTFVYLEVERSELERRMLSRSGHFMPASLLDSQLAALEPPGDDERALAVAASDDPEQIAARVADWLLRSDV